MTVVAIVYQKGEVGETTLATNLTWSLAETGTAVLVDADPRGRAAVGSTATLPPRESVCAKASNLLELCRRDPVLIKPPILAPVKIIFLRRPRIIAAK